MEAGQRFVEKIPHPFPLPKSEGSKRNDYRNLNSGCQKPSTGPDNVKPKKGGRLAALSNMSCSLPQIGWRARSCLLRPADAGGADVSMIMRGFIARSAPDIAPVARPFNSTTVQRERTHVLVMRHAVAAFF